MYADIEKNKRRSTLLIAAFIGLVVAIGWAHAIFADTGPLASASAVAISLGMTAARVVFESDSVALGLSGARVRAA